MKNEEHFRKLERMYLNANVNTMLFDTTTCRISDEEAEIGLRISEKYFDALGAIHGSVYFKLLDDAAFVLADSGHACRRCASCVGFRSGRSECEAQRSQDQDLNDHAADVADHAHRKILERFLGALGAVDEREERVGRLSCECICELRADRLPDRLQVAERFLG